MTRTVTKTRAASKTVALGATLAATILAGSLGAGSAWAADVTLKVHHFLPPKANTQTRVIEPWAKQIEDASGGRIAVEIYPAMQLGGKPPQLIDQVRDGVVDVVWTLPAYTPGRYPTVAVFELPFMVSTAEGTTQALQAFAEKHLADEFNDVHPLMFHTHARGVIHTDAPVEKVGDLAGMKIRAPSRSIGQALESMGATPVFMPVPALPEALSKGVVDGAVIPWEITIPLKISELVKNHTVTPGPRGLYTSVFIFAMNKDKYESLPDDLKKVIDDHSGMTMAKWVGKVWDEIEAPGLKKAQETGRVIELSEAEVAEMQKVTAGVRSDWVKSMDDAGKDGQALLDDANALIDQYTK
jgi:TRAP-type C4-dicarboxylate transport system substrate-binding protein